nr:DMT family transporter [Sneathiella glossodoripedis]
MKLRGLRFPTNPKILIAFLFMGLMNNLIPFSLIVAGQTEISSGLASVLNATTPLFAAVVAHFATKDPTERLGPKRISGIILGILGVSILLSPKIGNIGFSGGEVLGQIAILGAGLSYGIAVVFGRRFAKEGITPVTAATGQVCASTILMLPLIVVFDQPWTFLPQISQDAIFSVLSIAIFSTAIAYILYFELIKSAGATNASLVTLIIPASAMLLGVLFLDEIVTLTMIAGMVFIGLGLLVIDGRILRFLPKKKPGI